MSASMLAGAALRGRMTPVCARMKLRILGGRVWCLKCSSRTSPSWASALLDIGRDRVDDGIGSRDGGGDRGLIAHIGGNDRDPIDTNRSQLNPRRVWMPHSDAYSHPLGGQAV